MVGVDADEPLANDADASGKREGEGEGGALPAAAGTATEGSPSIHSPAQ